VEIRIVSPEDAAEIVRMANRIDATSLQTAQSFRALIERGAPEERNAWSPRPKRR
jgi:hypothetical protein